MDENPRLAEIELLFSMYQVGTELILEDTQAYCTNKSVEPFLKSVHEDFTFIVKVEDKGELHIRLPTGYLSNISMHESKAMQPIMNFRLAPSLNVSSSEGRLLEARFSEWIDETVRSSSEAGEPIICAAIEWLQLEVQQLLCVHSCRAQEVNNPPLTVRTEQQPTTVCLWIVSHHIRSPVKRRLIKQWAAELHLRGCSMPGKPGIVVIEGAADDAEEFWRRLRGLQWKHIQLRDREVLGAGNYPNVRFTEEFQELFLTHQSRFAWLHERNVSSDQFKLVFGIPGRISDDYK